MTPKQLAVFEELLEMQDEERLEIFNMFCKECGSAVKPCYCFRDE